ncbi:hypothetical protein EVAR_72542_1 [Eumeta japonica]|uniref:Uncharacterized protein n=1 Tax=Eumeta variegata TaxID=151549 RepID=A0A4C1T274_EUMVA|nr:hypothetical protein EVAR_72542_1 [Eumeta japonica]
MRWTLRGNTHTHTRAEPDNPERGSKEHCSNTLNKRVAQGTGPKATDRDGGTTGTGYPSLGFLRIHTALTVPLWLTRLGRIDMLRPWDNVATPQGVATHSLGSPDIYV